MKRVGLAGLLLSLVLCAPALAQISDDLVRIGVLTDETGPYADSAGPGSVEAARMAAEDFGGTVRGKKIEIVHADTQNKPDVASTVARRWFDSDKVDAVTDLPVTPIALAVLWMGVYPESFLAPMRKDVGVLMARVDRARPASDSLPTARPTAMAALSAGEAR